VHPAPSGRPAHRQCTLLAGRDLLCPAQLCRGGDHVPRRLSEGAGGQQGARQSAEARPFALGAAEEAGGLRGARQAAARPSECGQPPAPAGGPGAQPARLRLRIPVRGPEPNVQDEAPIDDETFAALMAPLGPFEEAPQLAVGVSGGAGSLALALLAARWAETRGGRAVALTVDHRLRPESAAEAAEAGAILNRGGIEQQILPWLSE